ncbi:MAG: hypothetical protein AMXMBFR19_11670 [Chthonomonadaceae bacterium]|uniref:Carboxylate/Amino Acid/Amine Transporter n=1 Tax=Candidatus Nitrosymbiomonas proteolyticus TaxID=2608984 RepID=A0A809RXS8_9BACT|nr:carboxylate/Amino Acid/Amine Transporter [Candidatus Nitrosymbiomonas proteolyticus]
MSPRPPGGFSLFLLLTVTAWGLNFVALKVVYLEVGPAALGFTRSLIMLATLVPVCWLAKAPLRYERSTAALILLQGFISMGLYMVAFLEALRLTGPAEGALVLSTCPVLTTLLAMAVRQEAFRWATLLYALVAFGGVALVIAGGVALRSTSLMGYLLMVLAALTWAVGTVISKPLVQKHSPYTVLTLSIPGALPVLATYGLWDTLHTPWTSLSGLTWLAYGFVALVAGTFGFVGFYVGVRQIGATGAMLYQYLVPVVAAVAAWLWLGQSLVGVQWLGMAITLAAVFQATRSRSRELRPPREELAAGPAV